MSELLRKKYSMSSFSEKVNGKRHSQKCIGFENVLSNMFG